MSKSLLQPTKTPQILEQSFHQFDQALARFLSTRKSEGTTTTYGRALRLFRAAAEKSDLDPLKADALIFYSDEMGKRANLTNDTKRLRLKAVQSFFTWLYTFGLSPIKPEMVGELIKIPPARLQSPRDILSEDEARQLLASVTPGRDRCLIRVMLDGGLRVSEALALTAPNIYEADNRHFVHVARRKGNKARDVEIPPDLYQSLQKFNGRLFSIHRSSAWRIVVKTAESAGVGKHITPHSLRHTHGHQLRLAGWPIEPIAQRLGHASIETTKVYTRPAELAMQLNLPQMPWNFEA